MDERKHLQYRLRGSRAAPPYLAATGDRRKVYDSALGQFDELIEAAESVGVSSQPLLLFYALSQASRAISAATAPTQWVLRGHGLKARSLNSATGRVRVVLDKPATGDDIAGPAPDSRAASHVDSFSGISTATGVTLPDIWEARVCDLWAALPEVTQVVSSSLAPESMRPIRITLHQPRGPLESALQMRGGFRFGIDGIPTPAKPIDYLANYLPETSPEVDYYRPAGMLNAGSAGYDGSDLQLFATYDGPLDSYADQLRAFRLLAPEAVDLTTPVWLRPPVSSVRLSRIATWWALLFALSNVARYEPSGWNKALDLSSSEWAAPIRWLLDEALAVLPQLVVETIELGPRES